MASPNAFHYIAIFPRLFDKPRPAWPYTIVPRFQEVEGVVDVIFPDISCTWRIPDKDDVEIRSESRRRFVEVFTSSVTPAKAKTLDDRLRALLRDVAEETGAGQFTLIKSPIESVEVL